MQIVVRKVRGDRSREHNMGLSLLVLHGGYFAEIGFSSCLADPDVWLRPVVKADGQIYIACKASMLASFWQCLGKDILLRKFIIFAN
jgi:hypothetical protein